MSMSTGVEKKYDIMTSGTCCEGEDAITCSYDDRQIVAIRIRTYNSLRIAEVCSIAALQG